MLNTADGLNRQVLNSDAVTGANGGRLPMSWV